MNIKKKLGMGIASAVLGISLVAGGTFAYFSDATEQTNNFASGTIDLGVEPEVQISMDNLKPGDWMPRTFDLQNNGSLDIKYVDLHTEYTVTRDGEAVVDTLADAYADQLIVQFLNNASGDKDYEVVFETSLKELSDMTPEDLANRIDTEWILWPIFSKDVESEGISAGETANFDVQFRFNDTGEEQNSLQNLDLDLTWTFEGYQTDGEEK